MASQAEMSTEDFCHQTRKQIDAIIQSLGVTKPIFPKGQRELALTYTKLQEAKMWMGKVLEELGSELPKEYQDKA
jgi:exonuclease VII small subunit